MREKKPSKKKLQGAETKKRLYEIAERLFVEHDFEDVSVEDITYEAGITKGAFYVHFESKDALIAMLIADHATQADLAYKTFLKMLPDDMHVSDVLLAMTQKVADELMFTIGCESMRKVYQMLLAGTIDTEAVKGYGRELYTLFYDVLEKGIQRREIASTLPLEVLSRHFVMAIRGVSYEWCIRYPDFDLKKQALEHCRLLIEGITV